MIRRVQVEALLREKPELSRVIRALNEAVKYGQTGSAKVLLDYLKSANVSPDLLVPVLAQAAGNGNTEIVEMIFQSGLTPYEAGNYQPNPVEKALSSGRVDTAIWLIQKGVKPKGLNVALYSDINPQISDTKELELVNALVKSRTDMDQAEWGTVLSYAAGTGDIALVDKILEKCRDKTVNAGLIPRFTYKTPLDVRPKFNKKMLTISFPEELTLKAQKLSVP